MIKIFKRLNHKITMEHKKTLIIGASANPARYAFMAAERLLAHGHEIVLLGIKSGVVAGLPIETQRQEYVGIDTVTLYVGPRNQPDYYDYIVSLKPARVIFNPGTENPDLEQMLKKHGIDYEIACTLVLLETGQY